MIAGPDFGAQGQCGVKLSVCLHLQYGDLAVPLQGVDAQSQLLRQGLAENHRKPAGRRRVAVQIGWCIGEQTVNDRPVFGPVSCIGQFTSLIRFQASGHGGGYQADDQYKQGNPERGP